MTQVISDERLMEILAGCEGVTPGPWLDGTHHRQKAGDREFAPIFADGAVPVAMVPLSVGGYNDPDGPRNAAHIARLDPDTVRSIVTELLSLRQQAQPTREEGWRVKPLEWEEVSSRIFDAGSICGLYRVKRYDDHWSAFLYGTGFNAERATADEAKAAAQADYASRISSALLPIDAPAREGGGETER